jgi:hypothetical protein
MNADLQVVLFFFCVERYTKHDLQTHCLYTNGFLIVYFWYHVLHIKCIFCQWMQVLPREREQVLPCGGVASGKSDKNLLDLLDLVNLFSN